MFHKFELCFTQQKSRPMAVCSFVKNKICRRKQKKSVFLIRNDDDFSPVVISAVFANLMRSLKCAAVAACAHCRCIELPNSRTSLVTSCLGDLILRYSHVLAPPSTFDSRRCLRSDYTHRYRTDPYSPPDKASLSAASAKDLRLLSHSYQCFRVLLPGTCHKYLPHFEERALPYA